MDKSSQRPPIEDIKSQAKALRRALSDDGSDISHSRSLELVAKTYGYRDWNTLYATVGNRRDLKLRPGQRVSGEYLGQRFAAEIIGIIRHSDDRQRITLQFDQPVDVITFDGMSNYRSRVSCVINNDGVTAEKTSNGRHHLRLERP